MLIEVDQLVRNRLEGVDALLAVGKAVFPRFSPSARSGIAASRHTGMGAGRDDDPAFAGQP
ncbi:hypothetical protein OG738_29935 [Amycolatopsis sp. NBC_01488]|uniref:hypothetical protein n=1 Tax=Amycolatopsis sp. NBC_01488 TaxID=2903563 RepID=UPI002E2B4D15|nr:hypothetical protein [Amycolatopsis sp. NBC_01488]